MARDVGAACALWNEAQKGGMDPLVSTAWLADRLAEVTVVDASYHLSDAGRDAAAEYRAAHIPGAVFLDLAALKDAADPAPMMLPPASEFAARMSAIGVGNDSPVVLYDDSPHRTAARAWWMLTGFGARAIAVLDGGFARWRAEGRPVQSGVTLPGPARFEPHGRPAVRDKAAILANLDSLAEQLVDPRPAGRFTGREPDIRPGMPSGHIPGSINLPLAALFDADGRWKSPAELRAAFEGAGVDLGRPIVTTCGSGITASATLFALHLIGVDAALYDGSWAEWGADPATPKATA
jgi:thiosulfate/3-mercaptopyruvate sulfurtransferase